MDHNIYKYYDACIHHLEITNSKNLFYLSQIKNNQYVDNEKKYIIVPTNNIFFQNVYRMYYCKLFYIRLI